MTKDLFRIGFDTLFSELYKITVNKVTFVCLRGAIAPTGSDPSSASNFVESSKNVIATLPDLCKNISSFSGCLFCS